MPFIHLSLGMSGAAVVELHRALVATGQGVAPGELEAKAFGESTRAAVFRFQGARELPRTGAMGLRCVFSRESVALPAMVACAADVDANLACHGYGSSVVVTASFGLAAAGEALRQLTGAAA